MRVPWSVADPCATRNRNRKVPGDSRSLEQVLQLNSIEPHAYARAQERAFRSFPALPSSESQPKPNLLNVDNFLSPSSLDLSDLVKGKFSDVSIGAMYGIPCPLGRLTISLEHHADNSLCLVDT